MHHHSLWFQWFYDVSKTVGGFAFTGLLGFVAVKKLKLDKRKLSDVPWSDVLVGVFVVVTLAGGATVVVTSAAKQDWLGTAVGMMAFVVGLVTATVASIREATRIAFRMLIHHGPPGPRP